MSDKPHELVGRTCEAHGHTMMASYIWSVGEIYRGLIKAKGPKYFNHLG